MVETSGSQPEGAGSIPADRSLVVDWCSHAAAKHAVLHFHYSRRMPMGKVVKVGVWEHGRFIGAVLFSWGANHNLASQFGLKMTECAELVRVALDSHEAPVSTIVARAVKLVRAANPGLRMLVSFADPKHGHHGGIYQAMNWLYLGETTQTRELMINGQLVQKRAYTGGNFGQAKLPIPAGAKWVVPPPKHRYGLPLDRKMRRQLSDLAKPYPKAAGQGRGATAQEDLADSPVDE